MSEIHVVTVGHTYEQHVYPREGGGKISGYRRSFRTRSDVAVTEVHPQDAPVAISLRLGSSPFDVRFFDGAFYRPLIFPTALAAVTFEEFNELALGDTPWRDNPFAGHFDRQCLDDNRPHPAFLEKVHEFADFEYRKVDPSSIDESRGVAQVAASHLIVVDGVVHRRCPQPELVLKSGIRSGGPKQAYRLTWRIGPEDGPARGIASRRAHVVEGDDDVYGPTTIDRATSQPHMGRGYGYHRPDAKDKVPRGERHDFAVTWRRFAIDDMDSAVAVAEAMAAFSGGTLEPTRPDLVDIVRPDLLAPGPRAPDTARVAKVGFREVNGSVREMSRDSVMDWLAARDAQATGDVEATLAAIAAILDRPADAATLRWAETRLVQSTDHYYHSREDADARDPESALGGLVRYVVVERHRQQELSADDLSALGLSGFRG